jgi:hypothetical protein
MRRGSGRGKASRVRGCEDEIVKEDFEASKSALKIG